MALYYLETSALVKLYIYERGTDRLLNLTASDAGNRFAIFSLAQVEFTAAIRRRQRSREIGADDADAVIQSFREHCEGLFLVQPCSDAVLDVAMALLDAYALKGYDSMQLAAYLTLRSIAGIEEPIFVCADGALLTAARMEGCATMNPELTN